MDDADASVAVLGLGASGEAAARLLLGEGRSVLVLDSERSVGLEERAARLRSDGADVRLRANSLPVAAPSVAVASPGVPPDSPLRTECVARGVPLISELELGWSRIDVPTIAVTGSNGKSSLVKWISESLEADGREVGLGGNYGSPACELAARCRALDWLVLEVSSFQLETCVDFQPDIAVLLNIHPNHLDRHGDMRSYRTLKERIFANCRAGDRCIFPSELDPPPALGEGAALWSSFGAGPASDWRYRDGAIARAADPARRWHRADETCGSSANSFESISIADSYFGNPVLGHAAAAGFAVCDAAGIDAGSALKALEAFQPLPHRVRTVAESRGVRFIDDSKATNLAAMCAALRMVPGPIRLIAGGRGKGEEWNLALPALRDRVAKAYLIGESASEMQLNWKQSIDCEVCRIMESAFERAVDEALSGEAILLSPACASFDQFTDFNERGDFFINCVNSLVKKGGL